MTIPRITVLIPAYNAERYIRQSIDSILAQTYPDFILMIINDGSSDGTAGIIQSYNDKRIQYINNPENIGLKDTLNKGIKLVQTEFIVRMDADDIAVEQRLGWQISYMDAHPEIGVSGGNYEIFGDDTAIVKLPEKDEDIKANLFFLSGICHPTVIMRTSVLKNNNVFYGIELNFSDTLGHKLLELEDIGLWGKLRSKTAFGNLDKVLIRYRKEGQNLTSKNIREIHGRKKTVYIQWLKELEIVDPPEEEVLFLFSLQSFKDNPGIENIKRYRLFLNRLVASNNRLKVYDPAAFEKVINRTWQQFFYFLTTLSFKYVLRYWSVSGGIPPAQLMYYVKFRLKKP